MAPNILTMLVGTYTSGESKGIYSYHFNQETGESTLINETEMVNPSYLTITSDNRFVYAVSETNDGNEYVAAFGFDKNSGALTKINQLSSRGGDPCFVETNDKYTLVANYSGGTIAAFPINADGGLNGTSEVRMFMGSKTNADEPKKAHLHCTKFSPAGNYLFAVDLGTDQIHRFSINNAPNFENEENFLNETSPSAIALTPGSGPRHLTFAPSGAFAYLICELSGEVVAFSYSDGELTPIQTILADTVGARGSADIKISPDGLYLYASNRLQADGIAIFKIDQADGTLTKVDYLLTGLHPRNFNITPNGDYLLVACRDSHVIEVYKRDKATGLLTPTTHNIAVDSPVCVQFAYTTEARQ